LFHDAFFQKLYGHVHVINGCWIKDKGHATIFCYKLAYLSPFTPMHYAHYFLFANMKKNHTYTLLDSHSRLGPAVPDADWMILN
jgi:hypothetical protein